MLSKIAISVRPDLDRQGGVRLQRSLMAVPGVKQVIIAYPSRVEVYYDGGETRAGHLLTVMKAYGLKIAWQ